MKIATWNISAGINPNDYKGEYFDKEKEATPDDKIHLLVGMKNGINNAKLTKKSSNNR